MGGGSARELSTLLADLSGLADGPRSAPVDELAARWSSARLRVMLVGEAKRGKSTVGNALLGRPVLPAGALPLTAVATTVRSGEAERIEIGFLDGRTATGALDDLATYVTESGNPHNRAGVREVVVHLPTPFLHPRAELVDTPGVGSVLAHNTEAAVAARRSVDVAVLVLSADPPITADERELLRELDGQAARTFVVLNKIDQLDEADRPATERFTRQVVSSVLGEVAVFPVSARQALRAVLDGDDTGWHTSGMADFRTELSSRLDRAWQEDLAAGVAAAAGRVAGELVDEAAVQVRTHELLGAREEQRVVAFGAAVDRLGRAGEDAAAAADAILARCRRDMDADASAVLEPLTAAVWADLDRVDAQIDGDSASAGEFETAGWAAITDAVVRVVGDWRASWSARLSSAVGEAAERLGQLLDDAVAQVRAAAVDSLGVDLTAPAPVPAVPDSAGFSFDVTPDIGWTQPVSSALRRRLPGRLGRTRMRRYLREEAARLVDKHIGRARSDFQTGLTRIRADLRRSAVDACRDRQEQLAGAVRLARRSAGDPSVVAAAADRLARLTGLAGEFDGVRAAARARAAQRVEAVVR